MCDYSLHFVASRPAKVDDKLVATEFCRSITRGFSAVGTPEVAVCLLPGTELAFETEVKYDSRDELIRQSANRSQGRPFPTDQHGRSARSSRCAGIFGRTTCHDHTIGARAARDRAAAAGRDCRAHATGRRCSEPGSRVGRTLTMQSDTCFQDTLEHSGNLDPWASRPDHYAAPHFVAYGRYC